MELKRPPFTAADRDKDFAKIGKFSTGGLADDVGDAVFSFCPKLFLP